MKVVTAAQMREIDRVTIEERGIPGMQLMEEAGKAVAREALERFDPDSVIILAGRGNNGGDGFVAARHLHQWKIPCRVILFGDPAQLKGDALTAWNAMPEDLPRECFDPAQAALELQKYDLIIDALLGTGTRGAVTGVLAEAIEAMNASRRPILAIDIPSGLPADGEAPQGPCVRAAATVTMALPKYGMLVQPGVQLTGPTVIADLNFPNDLLNDPRIQTNVLHEHEIGRMLPTRPADGNKGTFGKVLVLAGSRGMTGAAVMTARAAGRSGAGLVYVGAVEELAAVFDLHLIEAVKRPIFSKAKDHFDEASIASALKEIDAVDAVALGPGLSTQAGVAEFVGAICTECGKPMVIDADGLNALGDPAVLLGRKAATIVTPHPGEMARLLGISTEAVQADRKKAAIEFAKAHQVIVLLKGAQTLIARPDGELFINTSGNSGLAKGGSGDILTGLIAGLLAQGMAADEAAITGAFLHGLVGDLAARKIGIRAMTPLDLLDFFGEAFQSVEKAARESRIWSS